MKHYTYNERYNKLRNDICSYMQSMHNGKPFLWTRGGPRIDLRVSIVNRNGSKRIFLDIIAYKQKVGMGIEKICRLFENYDYEKLISEIEEEVVNHNLVNADIKVFDDKVRFRYEINPREEYMSEW